MMTFSQNTLRTSSQPDEIADLLELDFLVHISLACSGLVIREFWTFDVERQCLLCWLVILGFRDKRTAQFAAGERVAAFSGFDRQAHKRLEILAAATSLGDLRGLPSNRLEALRGDRAGQYSIRVNDQWRICFEWPQDAAGPSNVEIVDYH